MLTVRAAQFLGSCLLRGDNSQQQFLRCNVGTVLQLLETMSYDNNIATLCQCYSNNGRCESSRVILTAVAVNSVVQKSCSDVMMASFIIKEETRTIRHLECAFDTVSYQGLTLFTMLATQKKMALY